jgi:hypothetical protein
MIRLTYVIDRGVVMESMRGRHWGTGVLLTVMAPMLHSVGFDPHDDIDVGLRLDGSFVFGQTQQQLNERGKCYMLQRILEGEWM